MYASNITKEQLLAAAESISVRADVDTMNAAGTRHKVKLYPLPPAEAYTASGRRRKGEKGDAPYQRVSVSIFRNESRVHAVCWHGFRDYFRACFALAPGAIFRTAVDTWRGSEDFESRYRNSAGRNIGSQMAPRAMADACRCSDMGEYE